MDPTSVSNALQSQSIAAFGLAMPILAPDWVVAGSGTPSVDDSTLARATPHIFGTRSTRLRHQSRTGGRGA